MTLGLVCIFTFVQPVKESLAANPSIFWVPLTLSLVFVIILICAGDLRRKTPINLIFLGLFTVCEGVTIGVICATYDGEDVVFAIVTTAIVAAGLTLFAFQVRFYFM